ncbi:M50 family peptidase [Cryobacterium melibiosiphilum]|uniref:M50 family peptidase n=1 Tax=Cryobacterium melibiosiphilum TaxID=995039 RepID=A0A3A5MIB6_9MICO|nr:M50 family metallopeptidase [Cryobacterium melibiosiphilum]RJT89142.1 M50 family peptidase [Cryobacterium melibiosiphilum]
MDFLLDIWARVSARNDALPLSTAWLTIATAALLVALPVTWQVTRHVVTIAHEGGHGLVASLSGRKLSGIRLHSDTSGLTVSRGRPTGPGMLFTLLAGYTAPALLGLGAARLLGLGYDVGLLWVLLAALALLLVQIRNWFGLWSVLVTAAIVFSVTWFGSSIVQSIFGLLVTAFLLLGAVRTVIELQVTRSRRRNSGSDADQLARLTHVPGLIWVGVFLAVSLACLTLGAQFLGLTCVVLCA